MDIADGIINCITDGLNLVKNFDMLLNGSLKVLT